MISTDRVLKSIPISDIYSDNEFNCRGELKLGDYAELMQSIREIGLKQPIHVQSYDKDPQYKWRIVAGHRRYAAVRALGMDMIDCFIEEGLTEVEALLFNLRENLDRAELNILQEAKAIEHLKAQGLGRDETARRINKTGGWVNIRFKLLTLPKKVQAEAAAGLITQMQVLGLAKVHRDEGEEAVYAATRKIKEAKLKGETIKVGKAHPKPVTTKKVRQLPEIKAMLCYMMQMTNDTGNLGTAALAWAAGNITDLDFYTRFDTWCKSEGFEYELPREGDSSPHLEFVGKL